MGQSFGNKANYFQGDGKNDFNPSKTQSLSKDFILVSLDASPTPESARLKTSLKGGFRHFTSFNGERRLKDQIKSTQGYKYVVVVIGKVGEQTVKYLVNSPNVLAIYLCLGQPKYDQLPKSTKIRGYFDTYVELKKKIHSDTHPA